MARRMRQRHEGLAPARPLNPNMILDDGICDDSSRQRCISPEWESLLNGSLIFCGGRGNVSRIATIGDAMQTIKITDPLEARRCRYAQYRGEKVRLILNGVPVTGMIRSVQEDKSCSSKRWTVTVIPKQGIAAHH